MLKKWNRKICYIGVMVLFLAVTVGLVKPAAQEVFLETFAKADRRLPIYCVQTDEKKVAISFDAAWGACNLCSVKEIYDD